MLFSACRSLVLWLIHLTQFTPRNVWKVSVILQVHSHCITRLLDWNHTIASMNEWMNEPEFGVQFIPVLTSLKIYINQVPCLIFQVVIQPKMRCHSRKNTPYLPISKSFSLGSNTVVHELLNWCPTLSNLTKSHWIGFQPQNKSSKKNKILQ